MKRHGALLLAGIGPVLAAGLALATIREPAEHGPVYTVAQLQTQLAHRPRAWTNRPLLLRGVASFTGCIEAAAGVLLPCGPAQLAPGLADPTAVVAPLPLAWGNAGPLLAVARRMPFLRGLLPAPQVVDWGKLATYRVQLRAIPEHLCDTGVCVEVVLLDAAPDAPGDG